MLVGFAQQGNPEQTSGKCSKITNILLGTASWSGWLAIVAMSFAPSLAGE
jgi:hypothetical protein